MNRGGTSEESPLLIQVRTFAREGLTRPTNLHRFCFAGAKKGFGGGS